MTLLTRSKETVVHCQNRCPVLLIASTVVFNPKSTIVSAKMVFENAASATPLCNLTIAIDCFDLHGKPCARLDRFTYPHLTAGLNATFGYHIYAALSLETYQIEVAVFSAQFVDGTVWMQNNPSEVMRPAISQPDLSSLGALAPQYRREMVLGPDQGRLPVETPEYWICCCTAYNDPRFGQCRKCERDRQVQIKALDVNYLRIQNENFIMQQAERERQEAQAHDRADEAASNMMKRIFHLLLASFVCIAAILIALNVTAPARHYKAADALYESGNYTAALGAFAAIGPDIRMFPKDLRNAGITRVSCCMSMQNTTKR